MLHDRSQAYQCAHLTFLPKLSVLFGDDKPVNLLCRQYMARFSELLDLNRMYCNDLHGMANYYGIEAASKAIVKVRA